MRLTYLDNNATTKPAPEVIDAMLPFLTEHWGNPSSMYTFGGNVSRHIESARAEVANLIGAKTREIIFTSCGTESDNAAIRAALNTNPEKNHIITTTVEHPAVLHFVQHLEKEGYDVTYLPVDSDGMISATQVKDAITDETAIVSVMWANNETGVIFPIEEIAEICASRNVLFHTDAVQTAGKINIDVSKVPINYLTISGHKLHAPKGVGALYIRDRTPFSPLIIGGHQERGKRAGTENVASIIAFGKACELAKQLMTTDELTTIKSLRDKLEIGIKEKIPDIVFNGHKEKRLPNTSSISFEGIEGESILLLLNEDNICASTGSACSSGSLEPSHVLLAMGIKKQNAHGTIRFSLSRYNTEDDINFVLEKLPGVIQKLRDMSPISSR